MPYMYSEMQNKLSKTRESPLESMGQIISSRCPIVAVQVSSPWEVLLDTLIFMPPTLKKLMGHIAFGACVGACVRAWVGHTFCTYCNF